MSACACFPDCDLSTTNILVATAELSSSLSQFVTFTRSLKEDEKSEAQLFLDHFFRALGHGGVQDAGATLEFRIAKKPGSA